MVAGQPRRGSAVSAPQGRRGSQPSRPLESASTLGSRRGSARRASAASAPTGRRPPEPRRGTLSSCCELRTAGCTLAAVEKGVDEIDELDSGVAEETLRLFVSGNALRTLDGVAQFRALRVLSAASNLLSTLRSISAALALPCLEILSLGGNQVTQEPYYRLHVAGRCPPLRTLDGAAVAQDRAQAADALEREDRALRELRTGHCLLAALAQCKQQRPSGPGALGASASAVILPLVAASVDAAACSESLEDVTAACKRNVRRARLARGGGGRIDWDSVAEWDKAYAAAGDAQRAAATRLLRDVCDATACEEAEDHAELLGACWQAAAQATESLRLDAEPTADPPAEVDSPQRRMQRDFPELEVNVDGDDPLEATLPAIHQQPPAGRGRPLRRADGSSSSRRHSCPAYPSRPPQPGVSPRPRRRSLSASSAPYSARNYRLPLMTPRRAGSPESSARSVAYSSPPPLAPLSPCRKMDTRSQYGDCPADPSFINWRHELRRHDPVIRVLAPPAQHPPPGRRGSGGDAAPDLAAVNSLLRAKLVELAAANQRNLAAAREYRERSAARGDEVERLRLALISRREAEGDAEDSAERAAALREQQEREREAAERLQAVRRHAAAEAARCQQLERRLLEAERQSAGGLQLITALRDAVARCKAALQDAAARREMLEQSSRQRPASDRAHAEASRAVAARTAHNLLRLAFGRWRGRMLAVVGRRQEQRAELHRTARSARRALREWRLIAARSRFLAAGRHRWDASRRRQAWLRITEYRRPASAAAAAQRCGRLPDAAADPPLCPERPPSPARSAYLARGAPVPDPLPQPPPPHQWTPIDLPAPALRLRPSGAERPGGAERAPARQGPRAAPLRVPPAAAPGRSGAADAPRGGGGGCRSGPGTDSSADGSWLPEVSLRERRQRMRVARCAVALADRHGWAAAAAAAHCIHRIGVRALRAWWAAARWRRRQRARLMRAAFTRWRRAAGAVRWAALRGGLASLGAGWGRERLLLRVLRAWSRWARHMRRASIYLAQLGALGATGLQEAWGRWQGATLSSTARCCAAACAAELRTHDAVAAEAARAGAAEEQQRRLRASLASASQEAVELREEAARAAALRKEAFRVREEAAAASRTAESRLSCAEGSAGQQGGELAALRRKLMQRQGELAEHEAGRLLAARAAEGRIAALRKSAEDSAARRASSEDELHRARAALEAARQTGAQTARAWTELTAQLRRGAEQHQREAQRLQRQGADCGREREELQEQLAAARARAAQSRQHREAVAEQQRAATQELRRQLSRSAALLEQAKGSAAAGRLQAEQLRRAFALATDRETEGARMPFDTSYLHRPKRAATPPPPQDPLDSKRLSPLRRRDPARDTWHGGAAPPFSVAHFP